MKKSKNEAGHHIIYAVALISLTVMIAAAFLYIYDDYMKRRDDNQAFEAVVNNVVRTPETSELLEAFDENLLRRIDFDTLWQTNDDAQRWMFVPGTKIDAPVLNEPNVGSYFYNLRGLNKRRNYCGSFLVPKAPTDSKGNEVDDGHLFILGHRMNNYNGEWQFSKLPTRWGTKEGADKHPYIYIYYPDHAERWKVWMALDAWSTDMIYDIPTKIGSDDYEAMLKHAQSISRYQEDVTVDKDTHTLFMSTCNRPNGGVWMRFVLVSVPDANYYYDSKTYIDMSDSHKENVWKKGLAESRIKELDKLAPKPDFTLISPKSVSDNASTDKSGANTPKSH